MPNDIITRLGFISILAFLFLAPLGCGPPFCLVQGSLVATPNGPIPIENLIVGNKVISIYHSGEQVTGQIVKKQAAWTNSYLELDVDGLEQNLCVTHAHPLSTNSNWKQAGKITVNDLVKTRNGLRPVETVRHRNERVRVYNIAVSPYPNFFANGVLVHNKTFQPPPRPEDITDTWIGLAEEVRVLFRLQLREDGTGLCARTWSYDDKAELYKVVRWFLSDCEMGKGCKIEIDTEPIDPRDECTEPLNFKGKAYWGKLNLEVSEDRVECGIWKRKVTMHRETVIEEMNSRLVERMERHEAEMQIRTEDSNPLAEPGNK